MDDSELDPFAVFWTCSVCLSEQVDSYHPTVIPCCGDCLTAFDWEDITTIETLLWVNDVRDMLEPDC